MTFHSKTNEKLVEKAIKLAEIFDGTVVAHVKNSLELEFESLHDSYKFYSNLGNLLNLTLKGGKCRLNITLE